MPNDIINYLEKTLKIIKNNKIFFRYTEEIKLNINFITSIFILGEYIDFTGSDIKTILNIMIEN